MKRIFAITAVMLLSTAMFFVVVCAGADSVTKSTKGTWSGIGYNVGQGNCAPGLLQTMSIGKGVMTLTGESEWFSLGCLDPATGNGLGTAVITAANGDVLYLMINIQLVPETVDSGNWFQTEQIIGGTGRFEGSTGDGSSSGTYKFIGAIDVWAGTNEGEITF